MSDIENDEPLFALKPDESTKELLEFANTVFVSEEVRRECEAEMAEGKRRNWRWKSFEK